MAMTASNYSKCLTWELKALLMKRLEVIQQSTFTMYCSHANLVLGAAGFIHVANDMTGSRDPAVAIPRAVRGALNALTACHKEPGLKRFVFTSSSFAVTQPKPNLKFTVTTDTFNDEAIDRVKLPDPDGETVYSASKVECKRAIAT